MPADANFTISATDRTAPAFDAVSKKLTTFSARAAEGSNKLAGVASFIGANSTALQGMGRAADLASVGIMTLSGSMAVLGGPGGIALAAAAAIGAVALSTDEAEDSTWKYNKRLAELQGNLEKVRLIELRREFDETKRTADELQESLAGRGSAFRFNQKKFFKEWERDVETLKVLQQTMVELQKKINDAQANVDAGMMQRKETTKPPPAQRQKMSRKRPASSNRPPTASTHCNPRSRRKSKPSTTAITSGSPSSMKPSSLASKTK